MRASSTGSATLARGRDGVTKALFTAAWLSVAILVILAMGSVLTNGWDLGSFRFRVGDPGTNDFLQYWTAFRTLSSGGNPYDPAAATALVKLIGGGQQDLLVMMNPPWSLLLFSPVLWPNFQPLATF